MAEEELAHSEDTANSEELGRRKFLTGVIGFVGSVVAFIVGLPAIGYLISPGVKRHSLNLDCWIDPDANFTSKSLAARGGQGYIRGVAVRLEEFAKE